MKQVCVFSATYPAKLEDVLKNYMREPTLLRLNFEGEQLVGVKEYCTFCEKLNKAETLIKLLDQLVFNQCIIFCDTLDLYVFIIFWSFLKFPCFSCERVHAHLEANSIDCTWFGGTLPQEQRFEILKKLKNKQIRVLVTTDVVSLFDHLSTLLNHIFSKYLLV